MACHACLREQEAVCKCVGLIVSVHLSVRATNSLSIKIGYKEHVT
jgi:hypothetical protein